MALELKKIHAVVANNNTRYTYLEFTNGQLFQQSWIDGKEVWQEMPKLPQLEEPKVVAH